MPTQEIAVQATLIMGGLSASHLIRGNVEKSWRMVRLISPYCVEPNPAQEGRTMMFEAGDEGFTMAEQFYTVASSSPHRLWLLTPHR